MKKKSYIHPGMKRLQLDDDSMNAGSPQLRVTVEDMSGGMSFEVDNSGTGDAESEGAKGHSFSLWDE